jgi:hypothetical protein
MCLKVMVMCTLMAAAASQMQACNFSTLFTNRRHYFPLLDRAAAAAADTRYVRTRSAPLLAITLH